MRQLCLPQSFLDTYSMSTLSPTCSALCIVISFLVLWSTCLNSSLVQFTKGRKYPTSGTAQVFTPFIRFLLHSFVSWVFSFISSWLIKPDSNMPKYLYVSFSRTVLILSSFGSSIPSIRCRLSRFIPSMAYFSMPNSIPMSGLYILTACIRVLSSFFHFFCKWFNVI